MVDNTLLIRLAHTVVAEVGSVAETPSELASTILTFAERIYLNVARPLLEEARLESSDREKIRAALLEGIQRMRDEVLTMGRMEES